MPYRIHRIIDEHTTAGYVGTQKDVLADLQEVGKKYKYIEVYPL